MADATMNWLKRSYRTSVGVLLCLLTLASVGQACLWDWDTLQMERRRYPGTLEMITGKFVRHSPDYYQWRIQNRTSRISSPSASPDLADDLAVAYSKLGDHAKAIEILEQVLAVFPDRYETLANLGTIHMLAGDLQTGKELIDRAIVINPNAHFGREKYQSLLAEYFINERGAKHPLAEMPYIRPKGTYHGFAKFILEKSGHTDPADKQVEEELLAAQHGVLGMMHFANYDSPLLLEGLGDLLIAWPSFQTDALQLAARAYFRISELTDNEETKTQFREVAKAALQGQQDYVNSGGGEGQSERDDLKRLSAELEKELADAKTFVAAVAADEKRWIAEGADVDAEFAKKYYDSLDATIEAAKKQLASERWDERGSPYDINMKKVALLVLGCVGGVVFVFFTIRQVIRTIKGKTTVF